MNKPILLLIILISISSAFACKEKECCTKNYYSTDNIYNIQEIVNNHGGISRSTVTTMIQENNDAFNESISNRLSIVELRSIDNQENIAKLSKRVNQLEHENNLFRYYFNYLFKSLGLIK